MATLLVVGAVAADVIAGQRDGIARLGALGHEVVLQAGANALQVCAQSGASLRSGSGRALRRGIGGVFGEAVDARSSTRVSAARCPRLACRRRHGRGRRPTRRNANGSTAIAAS